jgi:hypothetical protein
MFEANPKGRHNRRDQTGHIDNLIPLQPTAPPDDRPLGPSDEPAPDKFDFKIIGFVKLSGTGPVTHKLVDSVHCLANYVGIGIMILFTGLSLKLIFTNWSDWHISIPKLLHFLF